MAHSQDNEKLKMHSPDLTQDNIAKIRELFPGCVTEAKDDNGKLRLAVDFDQLRQELSGSIVEGPQERYRLDWPGKRGALLAANAPIAKTLRPCKEESVNFDATKNLFIEGDNLEALKLLQETYLGKIKMIYIDPPYNTGNDFVYNDKFVESSDVYLEASNQTDEFGNRLVANMASNGRFHSDWLSMMYSRLVLSKRLLTPDGAVLISIDDNEASSLIKIGKEVFGEENFVAQLAVQLNPRGRHLDRFIANTHESVLVFVRDGLNSKCIGGLEKEGRMADEYNRSDENGAFRLLGLRNRNQAFNPTTRPNLYYPLYVCEKNGKVSLSEDEEFTVEVWPDTPDGVKTCWTWGKEKVLKENNSLLAEESKGEWRVFRKDYLNKDGSVAKTMAKSLWTDKEITNDYGRSAVKELFGNPVMDFPKSPALLKKLIKIGSEDGDIVLDFFAGSSSTAHALLELNAAEGLNRRFIMIQLPEATADGSTARSEGYTTIAELSKERIRRAGNKLLEGKCHPDWGRDVGFRVLKVATSNMKDVYYDVSEAQQSDLIDKVENVKEDRSSEDLLFQVLIDWGVDLTLPICMESQNGHTVFYVDENALVACFDPNVNESLIETLAQCQPIRAVFRELSFSSDSQKINVTQLFKQYSPHTEVKVI